MTEEQEEEFILDDLFVPERKKVLVVHSVCMCCVLCISCVLVVCCVCTFCGRLCTVVC